MTSWVDHEPAVLDPLTQLESEISEDEAETDLFCSLTKCDREEFLKIIAYLEKIGHL